MKKIILIFITLFIITGCYDYQELNNRAIVAGISIDYEENEYIINYEILNNQKTGNSEEQSSKSYLVEGKGETIVEAFQNASEKISKETYLSHLKVLILSEQAAEEKMQDIVDYMLREPNIRNIFVPVLAKEEKAKKILETTTTEDPVASEKIESLIKNNKSTEQISLDIDFDAFMDFYIDSKIDSSMTAISITDETLSLAGIALFKDGKYKSILDTNDSAVYNVLYNESNNHHLKISCENNNDGFTIINLYRNRNTDFEITESTVTIKSNLNATVIKDSCGYNFRDNSIYEGLSKKYEEVLKKEYENLFQIIQKEKTDVLGIRKKYYQKTHQSLNDWTKLKLETDINIEINKNGLTFEVKENE